VLNGSRAVTVNENVAPASATAGALICRWLAAAAPLTAITPLVPVIEAVSVPVIARFPAVRRVALKVPVPFVSVVSAGSVACGSSLVKCAVPP
jgi:hypothetical protein